MTDHMAGTRWIRWEADYFANPKARRAGVDGRALHLASACWAGGQLTDGHIPRDVVPMLCAIADVSRRAVDRVLDVGLWVPAGDGFAVHDYLTYNPARELVEREREAWRERQRRARAVQLRGRNVTP